MKRKFIINLIDKYNLRTKDRYEDTAYKRFYLFYLLTKTGMGCATIGKEFNRDHSTVLYGVKQHKKWYKLKDERYMNAIEPLMNEMLMFESEDQYIPVSIQKKGVHYDIILTLEIDKEIAESFQNKVTLNQIVAKLIEINTLSKV